MRTQDTCSIKSVLELDGGARVILEGRDNGSSGWHLDLTVMRYETVEKVSMAITSKDLEQLGNRLTKMARVFSDE